MRTLLITALAWTATANAFDVPKGAIHEVQTCKTVTEGTIYDVPAQNRGAISKAALYSADRYTWREGEVEFVVTVGLLNGDGSSQVETLVRREISLLGDVETESLQMTTKSTAAKTTDVLSSSERNEYKISGDKKILQNRVIDGWDNVVLSETIETQATNTGRTVTTTTLGPFTQKLSDTTGQYATIHSQLRTCTIDRAGQS